MNTFRLEAELQKSACRTEAGMDTTESIRAAREVLLQGLGLLFELGSRTYSHGSSAHGASIGRHYSQVLQDFRGLIKGWRAGEINYAAREGHERLQSEVTYASIATCDVLRALRHYTPETLARECRVVSGERETRPWPGHFASTIGRELALCTAHAIQHYAVIREICRQLGIELPRNSGLGQRVSSR
jgi:hypothetical protein